jgi:hypothetical protein
MLVSFFSKQHFEKSPHITAPRTMVNYLIVGTGDFAHGIAHLFMNYNSESSQNQA